ncbi:35291_t:CDS:1, partial [Gigaspora margarita]
KHVMLTVALLNNLDKLHKPESHYTLVLFPGTENYYTLQNTLASLISDLQFLLADDIGMLNYTSV